MGTVYFKQPLLSTSTAPEVPEERKGVPHVDSTAQAASPEHCCAKSVSNIAGRQKSASTQSVTRVSTISAARVDSPSPDQKSSVAHTSFGAQPLQRIVIVGTRRCYSAAMKSGCDHDAMGTSVLHLTQQRRSTAHVMAAMGPKPQELKPSSLHYASLDPKYHQQHGASRRLSSYTYTTRDTAQLRGRRIDPVVMQKQTPQRYPKREIKFLTHSQPCGTTVAGFAAYLMTILPSPDVSVPPCHQKETPVVSDSRNKTKGTQSSTGAAHESACGASASQSVKGRQVSLYDYLMLLRHRLMCCNSCFIIGGIYVNRFLLRHPELQIAPHELQYLSLISVVTAAKYIDDVFQTNSDYARVGGLPLNRFNTLEHYFLAGLGYSLHVTEEQFFAQLAVQESALAAGFAEAARSALLLCRFTVVNPSAEPEPKYPHHREHYPNQHEESGATTMPLEHLSRMESSAGRPQIMNEPHSVSARHQRVSYSQQASVMGGCGSEACHVASCKTSAECALPKSSRGVSRVSQHTVRASLETRSLSGEVPQLSKKVAGELVTHVPRLSTVSTRAPSSVRASSMSCEKEPFLNSSASSLSHSDTSSSSVALPVTKTPTTDDEMELIKHPCAADFSFSRVEAGGGPIDVNAGGKRQQFASHPSSFETDEAKEESDESHPADADTDDEVSTVYSSLKPTPVKDNTSKCGSCAWSESCEMSLPKVHMVQYPAKSGATQLLVPASYNIQIKRRTYAAHQGAPSHVSRTTQDDIHILSNQVRSHAQMRGEIMDKKQQLSGHETMQWQNVTHQNGCFAGAPVHTSSLGGFQTSSIQHSSPFRKKGNEGAYPYLSSTGQSCSTVSLHAHPLDWNLSTKHATRSSSDWAPATHVQGGGGGKGGSGGDGDGYIPRLHQSHSGTRPSYASNATAVCTQSQDVGAVSVPSSPSGAVALPELPNQFQENASCVRSHPPNGTNYLDTSASATARCSAKFGNAQGVGDQTDGLEFRKKQQPSYCAALRTASGFCAAAVAPPPPPVQSECHLELHAPAQYETSSQSGIIKTGSPRYPVFSISSEAAHCNVYSEAAAVDYYGTS